MVSVKQLVIAVAGAGVRSCRSALCQKHPPATPPLLARRRLLDRPSAMGPRRAACSPLRVSKCS